MSEHTPGPFRCQAEPCVRPFGSGLGMRNAHLASSDVGRHVTGHKTASMFRRYNTTDDRDKVGIVQWPGGVQDRVQFSDAWTAQKPCRRRYLPVLVDDT